MSRGALLFYGPSIPTPRDTGVHTASLQVKRTFVENTGLPLKNPSPSILPPTRDSLTRTGVGRTESENVCGPRELGP